MNCTLSRVTSTGYGVPPDIQGKDQTISTSREGSSAGPVLVKSPHRTWTVLGAEVRLATEDVEVTLHRPASESHVPQLGRAASVERLCWLVDMTVSRIAPRGPGLPLMSNWIPAYADASSGPIAYMGYPPAAPASRTHQMPKPE